MTATLSLPPVPVMTRARFEACMFLALPPMKVSSGLRCQIPWVKRNSMPCSVEDRPGTAVEYIYLMSKREDYFYDREATRIHCGGAHPGVSGMSGGRQRAALKGDSRYVGVVDPKDHNTRTSRHAAYQPTTRSRRDGDWLFCSIEDYTAAFQGLLVDGGGDPLALLVNPQPFSLEMCAKCKTCYEQREYRKLELDGKTPRCACGASEWISHFATFPMAMVTPLCCCG